MRLPYRTGLSVSFALCNSYVRQGNGPGATHSGPVLISQSRTHQVSVVYIVFVPAFIWLSTAAHHATHAIVVHYVLYYVCT